MSEPWESPDSQEAVSIAYGMGLNAKAIQPRTVVEIATSGPIAIKPKLRISSRDRGNTFSSFSIARPLP